MSSLGLALKRVRISSEQSSDTRSFKEGTEYQDSSLSPHRRDASGERSTSLQWAFSLLPSQSARTDQGRTREDEKEVLQEEKNVIQNIK